ncbi:MAG: helix-turn-helix domain-containing protein [Planctomycetota bacterium]|jgi:transcriptional regulator with XRE-family HTH domain|nr:helix-turn-helix domain-containing protein [Planctomycetota bacterium]
MNPSLAADAGIELMDSKRLARIVGANLRFLRKRRFPGWGGQKKFAEFLGLTPNDLCVYEYARSLPNEQRMEEMARNLGIPVEDLLRPLPGVTVPKGASSQSDDKAFPAGAELRERLEELKEELARLQGRCEVIQEQNRNLVKENQGLREANTVLRNLLYFDDSPEARERRERLLSRLTPSMADLARVPEVF